MQNLSMRHLTRGFSAGALSALVLFTSAAHSTVITISDTDFRNADWVGIEALDTTPNNSFSFTATRLAAGGNPGSYRQVINQLNTPIASQIGSGHIFQTAGLDPGQDGKFGSLDVFFDGIGRRRTAR